MLNKKNEDIDNIIEISNLDFSINMSSDDEIEKRIKILKNINLSIKRGEFLCIIGKNGSGKSTLAKMLNGILLPDRGEVKIMSMNTNDEKKIIDIRKNLGMVFQNPDNQIVSSVVEEEIAFGLENIQVETSEMRKRVDFALNFMGLYKYKNQSPNKLSGGQKQKLALASIIAMQPQIIVLDEPTAMLDPSARNELLKLILKLNKEKNITIVLITHFMEEIIYSDRIVLMNDGEIKKITSKKELFNTIELNSDGIVLPLSVRIKNELNKYGYKLSNDILTVDDLVNAL